MCDIDSSHNSSGDAIFLLTHIIFLPDLQKTTEDSERSEMMSDVGQCQLLRLLLKLMNAKKAIEVGLYILHIFLY